VRRYWPDTNPIGKAITFGDPADSSTRWIPVVGVVGHTQQERLGGETRVQVYLPEAQLSTGYIAFAVRTADNPLAMLGAVRNAVHSVDPDLPLAHINTMEQLIARSTAERRFAMLLLGGFGLLAMILASIGLYGVMSYLVTQRRRELGVRLVLGAEAREVLRLVLGEGLRLALAGVVIGLVAALALTRVMQHMLFDLSATDPLTLATTAALLVAVAAVASYLPARRATRVDPMETLRAE
jgi:ABC-type antimicrobial peptide transport system permease subunit